MRWTRFTVLVWLMAAVSALATDEREAKFAAEMDVLSPVPVEAAVARKQYVALGDAAYAKRAAASQALLMLGPGTVEWLRLWVKTESDPERRERANEIVARWSVTPLKRAARVHDLVEVWKELPAACQIKFADKLVDVIATLPAETRLPVPANELDGWGRMGREPAYSVVWRDSLFSEVGRGLRYQIPAANQVLAGFLDKPYPPLVVEAIGSVGGPDMKGVDVAPQLMRLAAGADKRVALEALSGLSNWSANTPHRKEITATLKKLYDHADPEIALQAAIISCYSGDESGFPRVLAATKSERRDLRLKAVRQLVDNRFYRHAAEVVPVLVAQLTTKDEELLERAIESLGSYPSAAKDVLPFLQHPSRGIVMRTILVLGLMKAKEAVPELERLRTTTTDQGQLDYIQQSLNLIQKP